ncbi:MAG: gliding motility-associated C-terminal domain-containing protein, partial [Saprospiraceae bacterium]
SSTTPSVTGQASAIDNCRTNITITFSDAKLGSLCDTTIIRTWTASDNCGNTASCTQTITKKDNQIPFISCPANVSVDCDSSINPSITGQATATDNCQNNVGITFSDTKSGNACDSTIIRTWVASDGCGNTSSCVQTITKKDNQPPIISCPDNVSVDCASSINPTITGEATATDNCQSDVSITFSDTRSGIACDSTIIRTWTATDQCNNSASCIQNITLLSDEPVIIGCGRNLLYNGANINNSCFANVSMPSPIFSSKCLSNPIVTNDFTSTNNASALYPVGTTNIAWMARYPCGLKVSCEDTITVSGCQDNSCCTSDSEFSDLIKKSFNTIVDNCTLTISTNQFDSCHYIISHPDFGDGSVLKADTISANGVWSYIYTQSGDYKVCMNIIAKNNLGLICQMGQICSIISIACSIPNVCCLDTMSFLTSLKKNSLFTKSECDICLPMASVDSCDIYTIDFGDGGLPVEYNGTTLCHSYAVKDTYNICIKAIRLNEFSEICLQKDTCFKVYVSCDPNEFCKIEDIKVPNGLTPNGDSFNDILKIVKPDECRKIDISIYNRWGQLVWAKNDYDNTWDGTSLNGNPLPDGTYYLILSLSSPNSELRSFKTFIDIRTD